MTRSVFPIFHSTMTDVETEVSSNETFESAPCAQTLGEGSEKTITLSYKTTAVCLVFIHIALAHHVTAILPPHIPSSTSNYRSSQTPSKNPENTILGAMRSSPADTLDLHAFLLPTPLLIHQILHRSMTRMATLPASHPLTRR